MGSIQRGELISEHQQSCVFGVLTDTRISREDDRLWNWLELVELKCFNLFNDRQLYNQQEILLTNFMCFSYLFSDRVRGKDCIVPQ